MTEAVTGSPADLAVIISGGDLKRLRGLADQALAVLRQIPGAADTFLEQESEQSQLRILVDRQAVARYGINVRDVQDVVEMAIGGKPVSTVFEGEKRFDVTVRFEEQARADADAIGAILVPTHEGGRVPLSQLARIEVVTGASIIARRENIRQISVRTNIRGRDQGSFVKEAQAKFASAVKLPRRLLGGLGRAVRKPGAGAQAADDHFADHDRDYLRAAVLHVRVGGECGAGAGECAVFAGRRDYLSVPAGDQLERLGGGGVHLAVRGGGDERGAVHLGDQPAAGGAGDLRWTTP